MKKLIIILIIFSASCTAKKSVTEVREFVLRDTVSFEKEVVFLPPINQQLVVEAPCDSLGNLRDFEKEIQTPKAKVTVKSVKGNLVADVNIDSIVDSRVSKFKRNYKSEKEVVEVEVVKYRYPLWIIFALVASVLLNVLLLKMKSLF